MDITEIYKRHVDTVYRVCYSYMKNKADTEDCVSDTFLKLIEKDKTFESESHEKAWLIRVAANICKNRLKHKSRMLESIDDHPEIESNLEHFELLDAVLALPDKYKTEVYLHYYEGYKTDEIAKILRKPASTVRNDLRDARRLLKDMTGSDFT